MAPQPIDFGHGICPERQALGEAYLQAVRDLGELLNAQARELVERGKTLDRFELALAVARKRRDETKLALALHTEMHGC